MSLKVSVKSELNHFSGRMLNGMKAEVSKATLFHWHEGEKLLDGSQGHLDISISYPIRSFPGESTLYVKVIGLPEGPRYLCFSHVVNGKQDSLSIEQGNRLIAQASREMIDLLKGRWMKASEAELQPGYFSNRYKLDLGKALDVELVRPLSSLHRPLIEPAGDRSWEKTTSLVDKERMVKDLILLSKESAPEPRKRSRRRQRILHQLEAESEPEARSKLYLEMAELHSEAGLKGEATEYLERSLQEKPSEAAYFRKREMAGPNQDPVTRWRRVNKDRGSMFKLIFGLEFDSNVVREEVDAFVDTDTRDWKLSLDGIWNQQWGWKPLGWDSHTQYHFHNESHTRYNVQDVIFQKLMQGWSQVLEQDGWKFDLSLEFGLHHLMSRGKFLMWGLRHRFGMEWYKTPKNVFSVFLLGSQKDFSSEFFDKDERSGEHRALRLGWGHGFDEHRRLTLGASWLQDDVGMADLSYDGYSMDGRFDSVDVYGFFESTSLVLRYERREYKAPRFGPSTRHQEDAEFEYGVEARKRVFEKHSLDMSYKFTDHQSTWWKAKYRRNQVLFNYSVSY